MHDHAMTADTNGRIPHAHATALEIICDRLPLTVVNWALTGSTALALRGIPVEEINDIDVQTDDRDWAEVQRRLREYISRPVTLSNTDQIRSYFGAMTINTVQVEIIGGVQRPTSQGWSTPIDPAHHRELVTWHGRTVPVVDLDYEADAYERLGRTERADDIRAWIAGHP